MRRTVCDECQHDFNIKLKTKKHNFTITESYFVCPKCKTKYTAFVLDGECKKMQNQINKLQPKKNKSAQLFSENKISESEYKKQINLIDKQIKRVQMTLLVRMDALKQTHTG